MDYNRLENLKLLTLMLEISGNVYFKILELLCPDPNQIGIKQIIINHKNNLKKNEEDFKKYLPLEKKYLNALQKNDKLQPEHLDICLLFKLIKDLCGLSKNKKHWRGNIDKSKNLLEHMLWRIQNQRNYAVHNYRLKLHNLEGVNIKICPAMTIDEIKLLLQQMIEVASEKSNLKMKEREKWKHQLDSELKFIDKIPFEIHAMKPIDVSVHQSGGLTIEEQLYHYISDWNKYISSKSEDSDEGEDSEDDEL